MSSKKFSPFYTNSVSKNFNNTMNRLYELVEHDTYHKEKTVFEASILTGDATNSSTKGFFDKVVTKLFGDNETKGYKIRFSRKDSDYNSFPDPNDFSGEDRLKLIQLHPFAYLIEDLNLSEELAENTSVVVELIDDVYVITEIIGIAEEVSTESRPGSKKSWSSGSAKTKKGSSSGGTPGSEDSGDSIDPLNLKVGPVVENLIQEENTGIIMIGDSQFQSFTTGGRTIGGWLHTSLKSTYGRKMVEKLAEKSTVPSYWNSEKQRERIKKKAQRIEDRSDSEYVLENLLFIILLGGNLSVESLKTQSSKAKELITFLKKIVKTVKIIWIGAPTPASDGTIYNKNGKSLEKRKTINDYLETELSSDVDIFINPTKVPGYETEYSCGGNCDGHHMPGQFSLKFLLAANLLGEK